MFDLRYHAASLAAVFLALIIGILVGVGVSRSGFVSSTERKVLNQRIADLEAELEATKQGQVQSGREQQALEDFVKDTYPSLVAERLKGMRVAIVFVGPVDTTIRADVLGALVDAGAPLPLRVRAIGVPVDPRAVDDALPKRSSFVRYRGNDHLKDLGRALGQELVKGGRTPLWNVLASQLLEEQSGTSRTPADAVVIARTTKPQLGATARLLGGLYSGIAGEGRPAVGVETSTSTGSAVAVYKRKGLSSIDSVDTLEGKVALVFLLAGGQKGSYGLKPSADDGVLPPMFSVPPVTTGG